MNAEALSAGAPQALPDPVRVSGSLSAMPEAEVPLAAAVRWRASLIGLGLGVLAFAVFAVGGLAIAAGPFHTSLGGIA